MPDQYFVISTSEDGDVSLVVLTKEKLIEHLGEEYWGECKFKKLPRDGDFCDLAAKDGLIIIKGELVTPKGVEVVKGWDV